MELKDLPADHLMSVFQDQVRHFPHEDLTKRVVAEVRRRLDEQEKKPTYCAYCGFEVADDDAAATKISKHIRTCEKHPMRELEFKLRNLQALVAARDLED